MVFVRRQLDQAPQSLGEKLRALRRGQAVSMKMMERATHIQRRYLESLERGRYDRLPEPLYTRNFIRAYARVLKADENYFLELYAEECGKCDLVTPMRTPRQKVRRSKFLVWGQLGKYSLLSGVALVVFGYLGWQITSIMKPPEVFLFAPAEATMTSEAMIAVEGVVTGEATVYINGEQVVVDEYNQFATEVDLARGLNIITVQAERQYSRPRIIERRVVFDPEEEAMMFGLVSR